MKNRITLLSALLIFLVFAALYSWGMEDSEESELNAQVENLWDDPTGATPSEEPNADNVAASYFEKVEQLKTYLKDNPADTTHILRLARLYQEGHQPVKASQWYEKYLELQPNDIQSLLDLANTYGEAGEWEKALRVTDRLLLIEPDNGKALYNKAAILANKGELNKAAEIWHLIVEKDLDKEIVDLSKQALKKLANM